MKITDNFTLEELISSSTAKNHGINNTPTVAVKKNLILLANNILQPLREAYGHPIIVTSGYRCEALNKIVSPKNPNSDHRYGNAADIRTVSDSPSDNKQLFELALALMRAGKLKDVKQIIDEYDYNWIHISFQDGRTSKRNQILHLK